MQMLISEVTLSFALVIYHNAIQRLICKKILSQKLQKNIKGSIFIAYHTSMKSFNCLCMEINDKCFPPFQTI